MQGRIIIVGAGHAGGAVAEQLRQQGWSGPITLIGEEPLRPYQRPPLSKAWLKDERHLPSIFLYPENFLAEHDVDLRLGQRVDRIDRLAKRVVFADGSDLAYDHLILATGARPRRLALPGADLSGVLALRTAADADRLRLALRPGRRLAIIGAGYVGLEVAASARALGVKVTIIEREPRLLARVASPPLSAYFLNLHRRHGVVFELSAGVAALETADGANVQAVRLADGRTLECDTALISVGAEPNTDIALAAGLECRDGVVVNLTATTSDPDIFAVGDCTFRPLPRYGDYAARLESVPSAMEQVRLVAAHLCGAKPPAPEVPWFWSDQYDVKLQIAGLALDVAERVVRGTPTDEKLAVFHLDHARRVQAVEAANSVAEFMVGRQLISVRIAVDPAKLADATFPIKQLLAPVGA